MKFKTILATALAFFPAILAADESAVHRATWMQLHPVVSPSARSGMAMAYDPVSGKVILFGGIGPNLTYFSDTWTFDGTTWTKLSLQVSPPPRTATNMAYDAALQKLVLFGGFSESAGYFGDTWVFDGATLSWQQATPATSPSAVTAPSVFSDPLNGRVDTYGGFDGRFYQLKTWQFDGTNWIDLHPKNSPSARSGAIAALDYATKTVVLSQGLADVNPANTWTWDGSNWTEQSPAAQPPVVYNAGAAFDSAVRVVVAFGGGSGGVDQNATWAWTGRDWIQGQPVASPSRREFMGMVNDVALGHIVLFGGASGNKLLNDTWELVPSPQ